MKIATIVVRVMLGLLYVAAAVLVLFNLAPQPELSGAPKEFMEGMNATGYMLKLIKITELVCGASLVSGYYVPLALVIIAPVSLNIFLYHAFVMSEGLPAAVFILLATAFLGFSYRERYAELFKA
jgi:uncharacterized membrane protein YphA (DoxX/SURF4 family)